MQYDEIKFRKMPHTFNKIINLNRGTAAGELIQPAISGKRIQLIQLVRAPTAYSRNKLRKQAHI